jgi:hypothetical protein
VLAALAAGCGSSSGSGSTSSSSSGAKTSSKAVNPNAKEKSPPGDIPDNQAFVRFALPGAGFSVKVPEGWSRVGAGRRVTFTSNLNSVTIERRSAGGSVSAAGVRKSELPALRREQGFKLRSIATVHRSGGTAVRIQYLAQGKANPVTGKAVADAVERYLFAHNGIEAVLTLAGPNGSDNVDPWRTVSDSLRWTR